MRTAIVAIVMVAMGIVACQSADVSRELGARCDASSECDGRCLLDGDGYPGGFCTLVCNTSSECPSGASCVERDGGVCLFDCGADPGCEFLGAGWRCQSLQTRERPELQVKVCRGG